MFLEMKLVMVLVFVLINSIERIKIIKELYTVLIKLSIMVI